MALVLSRTFPPGLKPQVFYGVFTVRAEARTLQSGSFAQSETGLGAPCCV
jgi:hypothetical protein